MKAHELAQRLLDGPDLPVVYVEIDNEYGYRYLYEIDEIKEVVEDEEAADRNIDVPYLEIS